MIQYTKEYIKQLLDKFMAGTSTLEEEDILSHYFSQSQIPAEWEQYRLLFAELEVMKPTEKPKRRWLQWGVAAAVAVIALLTVWGSLNRQQNEPLLAGNGTEQSDSVMPIVTHEKAEADTIRQRPSLVAPEKPRRRSLRKQQPTLTDYDKGYALMAEAEQERLEAEKQLEECQMEIIDAQLAAYGFIPVTQEDGTIIYINEQTNYIAYEE